VQGERCSKLSLYLDLDMRIIICVLFFLILFSHLDSKGTIDSLVKIKSIIINKISIPKNGLIHRDTTPYKITVRYGTEIDWRNTKMILLVDGLSILDTIGYQKVLISNIDTKSIMTVDLLKDTNMIIQNRNLKFIRIFISTNDTSYLTLKEINKKSFNWTSKHPLTSYIINNRLLGETEKFDLLRNIHLNSIKKVDTIVNKDFPNGLIKIKTR
jgi:hypothetical protein